MESGNAVLKINAPGFDSEGKNIFFQSFILFLFCPTYFKWFLLGNKNSVENVLMKRSF